MSKYLATFSLSLLLVTSASAQRAAPAAIGSTTTTQPAGVGVPIPPGLPRNPATGAAQDVRSGAVVGSGVFQEIIKRGAEQIQARREEFRVDLKEKQDAMQSRIQAAQDAFRKKLGEIKDERKRQVAERVGENLSKVLTNRIGAFSALIDNIDALLGRVKTRRDKVVTAGGDVSAVNTAIAAADVAVAAARTAVTGLAGKTYVPKVTTDATLKTDLGAARDALKKDLLSVQNAVKAARDAVKAAAVALKAIVGVDSVQEPAMGTPPSSN